MVCLRRFSLVKTTSLQREKYADRRGSANDSRWFLTLSHAATTSTIPFSEQPEELTEDHKSCADLTSRSAQDKTVSGFKVGGHDSRQFAKSMNADGGKFDRFGRGKVPEILTIRP